MPDRPAWTVVRIDETTGTETPVSTFHRKAEAEAYAFLRDVVALIARYVGHSTRYDVRPHPYEPVRP